MSMFTKDEAFDHVKNFLQIENGEQRMTKDSDRRNLLDEIAFKLQSFLPFQSLSLLNNHPSERRKPTTEELKSNFTSGIGGLCFDLNISTFHLLTALGFDVLMTHATVSTTVTFPNNHVLLLVNDLEKNGDQFLVDVSSGYPLFQAVSLDFEKESPVYLNSYLELKFVRHEGQLLRMHRRGDLLATGGRKENSEIEFWIDDWRRFLRTDLQGTKNLSEFEKHYDTVYTNSKASPFHFSPRSCIFREGKAIMVVNDKVLAENDQGELTATPISGGDEGICAKFKEHFPIFPEEFVQKSLQHWREALAGNI